ncbi:cobalt ABC transporter, permease protein CbiQ [Desulfocurvibacter africanus PCS]|uniref:Cobalt ABC transporter, permease protein CbiQ n=1 Tax=Desulfocurvibacter africanus PCS TaxID=1262666 RepID=M5PUD8_DESAF|nr:cobalt ECF transporter T component CbiQ [Desulfocurvibacter africanus]EMG37625.1 cobalt ABC transporter, permease protein CbiQ [Desulfocurvibacter africanus PCS]
MISEPLTAHGGLLSRLDPRMRLAAAIGFSVTAAVLTHIPAALAALACGLLLLALSGLSLPPVLKRLLLVNGFVAFLWLFLPFSTPGESIWSLGPLAATRQGLAMALLVTLKANAILLAFMALASAMGVPAVSRALSGLGLPRNLAQLVAFSYRYLFVLGEEYHRLRTAAAVRGFRPRTDLHTYRTYAHLLGMVLVRSLDRSERVYQAMICRGFDGVFRGLDSPRLGQADTAFGLLALVAVTTMLYMDLA